ncbi:MAG TPA: 2-oxo acid dehydrogenase subunit E2 [Candidatus Thermoplasmatota archaeon]|nr:2-oxo acid dehydrogenase subunit E2 [Candidatus Thermoplasmatota archaeon]
MDRLGNYEIRPFTKDRRNVVLVTTEGKRRRNAHALLEVDVTLARGIMQRIKEENLNDVSFTGWVIKCIAQAASEHKLLNAYRQGRRKLVLFDDVDVSMPIEREVNGEALLIGYIIRKANEKSVADITREIRSAQQKPLNTHFQAFDDQLTPWERRLLRAPVFMKKLGLVLMRRNGMLKKKHLGTIGVTAIGMKGRFPGFVIGMGGPIGTFFALGGITQKPGVVDGKIQVREFLHLTIHVDHDVVDGGPVARFIDQLVTLLETGFGLS